MKVSITKHKLYLYLLVLLSITVITIYIWFRFIRERIPRDIPFNFIIVTFVIVASICFFYAYRLYRTIKPSASNIFMTNPFILKMLTLLSLPFSALDDTIKSNNSFNKFCLKILNRIIKDFNLYHFDNYYKFYITFYVVPKILLLLSFFIDILYFSKLEYFYNFIMLGIIPLLYTYMIYTITKYIENTLQYLELRYEVIILSTREEEKEFSKQTGLPKFFVFLSSLKYNDNGNLDLRYFVEIQSLNIYFEYEGMYKYTYSETSFAREEFAHINNIELPPLWVYNIPHSDDVSKGLNKPFTELMPSLINFYAFIELNDFYKKM